MEQQLLGVGKPLTEVLSYGKGVKEPGSTRYDANNIVQPDMEAKSEQWQSVTHAVHLHPNEAAPNEFSTTFKLKGGLPDREAQAKYRAEWTSDTPAGAAMRFKTSASTAAEGSATSKFRSKSLRKLPGTPLAVEHLRENLADCRGFSAIMDIKKLFKDLDVSGDGTLQGPELKKGLADIGVKISEADFEQIFKFFDKSGDGSVSLDEFATCLRGSMSKARVEIVKEVFAKLDVTGDGVVKTDDLKQLYFVDEHPEYRSGKISQEAALKTLLEQWDMYERDGIITIEDFLEYYHDLGSCIDDDLHFEWMLKSAWQIGSTYVASSDKAFKEHKGTEKGF